MQPFGRWVTLTGVLASLIGCTPAGEDASQPPTTTEPTTPQAGGTLAGSPVAVSGYAQKGPVVSGSTVRIQVVDPKTQYAPTGQMFETTTTDNAGAFAFPATVPAGPVEVIVEGYYFNEVGGALSDGSLTLRALADLTKTAAVNVNILTTLSKDRIVALAKQGIGFTDAKVQAEAEVLAAFHITDKADVTAFETMDITKAGASNAVLLALSVSLQRDLSVAQLAQQLSQINLDLATDGKLDDPKISADIKSYGQLGPFTAGKWDQWEAIRDHLNSYYQTVDIPVDALHFEDYLDDNGNGIINKDDPDDTGFQLYLAYQASKKNTGAAQLTADNSDYDGDGVANKDDADTYVWKYLAAGVPGSAKAGVASFDGELWVMGRDEKKTTAHSADGIQWTPVAAGPWTPREEMCAASFNNELWIISGREFGKGYYNTAIADAWRSTDGINWVQDTAPEKWGHHCFRFGNALWIIGGVNITKWSGGPALGTEKEIGSVYRKTELGKPWAVSNIESEYTIARTAVTVHQNAMWVATERHQKPKQYGESTMNNPWIGVKIQRSLEGKTWETVSAPDIKMNVLYSHADKLWGHTATKQYVSSDGKTWKEVTTVVPKTEVAFAADHLVVHEGIPHAFGETPTGYAVWKFVPYTEYWK